MLVLALLVAACACARVALGVGSTSGTARPPAVDPQALPAGPRLAVAVERDKPKLTSELLSIGPAGEDPQAIARESTGFFGPIAAYEHPSWSPDGEELAFEGPAGETTAIYLIDADGSNPHLLRTSAHPGGPDDTLMPEPVFDPISGDLVVSVVHTPHGGEDLFSDDERPDGSGTLSLSQIRQQFWALPTDASKPHRLSDRPFSRKHDYFLYPYSVAGDGEVAATLLGRRGFGVALVDPRSGAVHTVVGSTTQGEGSLEPAISPDGRQIVYKVDKQKGAVDEGGLISTDLMIVPATGGKPKLLARIKGGARWPSWDPSGSRIALTALGDAGVDHLDGGPSAGSALMEINGDGTCLTKVYSAGAGGVIKGSAWQPGAERGAGPISC
jgi:dipeptidyl aminopeptidase/acylaminoacyl peptidase